MKNILTIIILSVLLLGCTKDTASPIDPPAPQDITTTITGKMLSSDTTVAWVVWNGNEPINRIIVYLSYDNNVNNDLELNNWTTDYAHFDSTGTYTFLVKLNTARNYKLKYIQCDCFDTTLAVPPAVNGIVTMPTLRMRHI
jgi:hypothetical protein